MDLEQIGLLGGAVSTVIAIGSAIMGLRGWWRRTIAPRLTSLDEIALLIQGRPAIVAPERPDVVLAPALPGALERLTNVDDRLGTIGERLTEVETSVCDVQSDVTEVKGHLYTNGGRSLRDAVNRIEDRLGEAS